MTKRYNFKTSKSEAGRPSDEALLSLLKMNMQRLPLNDNISPTASAKPLGLFASIGSSVASGVILLIGAFILFIFALVPASKDSEH
ncbi:hypothetical protein [Rhizobium sp. RU33A]|uniref:hypothetical protein n=1 Tax=Rhizobium sp. RU33A TaxID=1907413 RepID=UPI0011156C16|nr:hypothetical protein [Rhizobium sp. RU33A]